MSVSNSLVVTLSKIMELVESGEDVGLCISCGNEQFNCEPDARKYRCESCGELKVYGAEELLIMLA